MLSIRERHYEKENHVAWPSRKADQGDYNYPGEGTGSGASDSSELAGGLALARESGVEPVVGYRRWEIGRSYPFRYNLLSGTQFKMSWPHFRRLKAECWKHMFGMVGMMYDDGKSLHDSPDPEANCMCGVNAYRDAVAMSWDITSIQVVGEVYLWGRVMEYADGWRAQYGYPKNLVVVGPDASKVATDLGLAYGVPCEAWEL